MPTIKISTPHQLGATEAQRRIRGMAEEMKTKYGDRASDVQESWNGNRGTFAFKAMGFAVSGSMDVRDNEVVLEANLPFAAIPFKSQIERELSARAKSLLS